MVNSYQCVEVGDLSEETPETSQVEEHEVTAVEMDTTVEPETTTPENQAAQGKSIIDKMNKALDDDVDPKKNKRKQLDKDASYEKAKINKECTTALVKMIKMTSCIPKDQQGVIKSCFLSKVVDSCYLVPNKKVGC